VQYITTLKHNWNKALNQRSNSPKFETKKEEEPLKKFHLISKHLLAPYPKTGKANHNH
jgi:hypothetical protein